MAKAAANQTTIELADGRVVFQSYGVTVAAFIPRGFVRCPAHTCLQNNSCAHPPIAGYVRTDARYSQTTSRHMNRFAGPDATEIPHALLLELTQPVVSRQ